MYFSFQCTGYSKQGMAEAVIRKRNKKSIKAGDTVSVDTNYFDVTGRTQRYSGVVIRMIDQNERQDARVKWLDDGAISVVPVEDLTLEESSAGNTATGDFVFYEKYKLRVHMRPRTSNLSTSQETTDSDTNANRSQSEADSDDSVQPLSKRINYVDDEDGFNSIETDKTAVSSKENRRVLKEKPTTRDIKREIKQPPSKQKDSTTLSGANDSKDEGNILDLSSEDELYPTNQHDSNPTSSKPTSGARLSEKLNAQRSIWESGYGKVNI